jgi:adenosylhomocysteinase
MEIPSLATNVRAQDVSSGLGHSKPTDVSKAIAERDVKEQPEPILLALEQMPVLADIRRRFLVTRPFENARIAIVFHLTKEAAALALAFHNGGATVRFIPSKIRTVEKKVTAALAAWGVEVQEAATEEERATILRGVPAFLPDMLVDNADLFGIWHSMPEPPPLLCASLHSRSACAIAEMYVEKHGALKYPVLAIGSTPMKLELESMLGTGQSALVSLVQATGIQLSGKRIVVIGFGNVGSGIANFARSLNARVCVVQNSPFRALKAVLAGFEVLPLSEALPSADIVITATGSKDVLQRKHFEMLRDGAMLGNLGRSHEEIDVISLRQIAMRIERVNSCLERFTFGGKGKKLLLLGGGHQFNHMAGSPNSSELMDLSLSLHAIGLEHVWCHRPRLPLLIQQAPDFVVNAVAKAKLEQMNIEFE